MNENLHNIDDLFKRALNDDEEEEPSAGVWENIDRKLDKRSVININRKYRRVKWVAAASIIMVCALGMYTLYTRKVNKELVNKNRIKINETNKTSKTPYYTPDTALAPVAINPLHKQGIEPDKQVLVKTKVAKGLVKENMKEANTSTALVKRKSVIKKRTVNTTSAQNLLASKTNTLKKKAHKIIIDQTSKSSPSETIAASNSTIKEKGNIISSNNISKNTSTNNNQNSLSISNSNDRLFQDFHSSLATELKANMIVEPGLITPIISDKNIPLLNHQQLPIAKNKTVNIYTPKINKSPFSATVFFSPDIVKSRVQNDRQSFREDDKNEIKRHEKTKTSSSMGVLVNYNFSKKWSLQTGLTYFSRATNIEAKTIYARPNARGEVKYRFNCSVGYSYVDFKSTPNTPASGDSIKAPHSKSTLQYIGVPLAIKYNFGFGRFSLSPAAGISANFLTQGNIETSITSAGGNEEARITDIQGLKSNYFSGMFSLTAAYKLSETFAVSFGPVSRFALTSINKDAPVKTYLNSTGLAAGLTVSF